MQAIFCSAPQPIIPVSLAQPETTLQHPLLGTILPRDQLYLESCLGSGGFSVVFRGIHTRTGDEYAVKVIPFAPTGTPLNTQQKAEACLHTRASGHRNIVKLHKYFLHPHNGMQYLVLVMDLVRGPSLCELVNTGFLVHRPELLRRLFGQMLDAVAYCHHNGIYHRDIKIENFLCSQDLSTVYLADFGMATVDILYRHVELGSVAYMSPETAQCVDPTTLIFAPSTDVWSLGVLLLTLLTGHAPWQTATRSDGNFVLFEIDPSTLFDRHPVPLSVEMLLRRALTCNPGERISLHDFRLAFFLLDEQDLVLPPATNLNESTLMARAMRLHRTSPGLVSDSGSAESSESALLNTPSASSSQQSSFMIFKGVDI